MTSLLHKALEFIHVLLPGAQLWVSPGWSPLLQPWRQTLTLRGAAGTHTKLIRTEFSVLYVVSGGVCGVELFPSQHQVNAACQEGAIRTDVHWEWPPPLLCCPCAQTLVPMGWSSWSHLWPCWLEAINLLPKPTAKSSCHGTGTALRDSPGKLTAVTISRSQWVYRQLPGQMTQWIHLVFHSQPLSPWHQSPQKNLLPQLLPYSFLALHLAWDRHHWEDTGELLLTAQGREQHSLNKHQ